MDRTVFVVSLLFCLAACVLAARSLPTESQLPAPLTAIPSARVSALDGSTMVYVPAGDFIMGSADSDVEPEADTKPQHAVYLDAFWIDRAEVTNAAYSRCIAAGPCQSSALLVNDARPEHADHPVQGVTWDMARTYCEWAGRRLPTEAEWEKAARGTDERQYPWGNTLPDPTRANYTSNIGTGSNGHVTQVGSFHAGASPYGAVDMAGNLWEWVADWYSDTYFAASPRANPRGPATGAFRACRGGSWNSPAADIRVTNRGMNDPSHCDGLVGIRCACSAGQC